MFVYVCMCNIVSYHIISYHIIIYYILLFYVILYYCILYYIILNYIILYYIIITIIWYVPRHFFGLQYISSGRGTPAHPMREQAAINPTNHAKRAGPWSPPHVWRFFIGKCMVNPSYFGGYSSFSKNYT